MDVTSPADRVGMGFALPLDEHMKQREGKGTGNIEGAADMDRKRKGGRAQYTVRRRRVPDLNNLLWSEPRLICHQTETGPRGNKTAYAYRFSLTKHLTGC